jgi:hypothetical protein
MQLAARALTRLLAVFTASTLALALLLVPSSTRADDKVAAGVTYFLEPAPSTGLNVIHPQVTYGQDYTRRFGMDLGYNADIVSGATVQIFDTVTRATPFSDVRHAGNLGFRFMSDYATLNVAGGFAGESDYRSGTVSVGMSSDMFNRNTTVGLDYTHNFDSVCDASNAENQELLERAPLDQSEPCFTDSDVVATRSLSIDSVQASVTQVVTPWWVLQVGVSGQVVNGFQSNPYRQVRLGPRAVQEHLPEVRNRMAGYLRSKWALKPIRGSIEAFARGYADSWALESFTAQLAWDQYIVRNLVARVRARWHIQDSALFYRDANEYRSGGSNGSYWTGDRELSALANFTAGAKIGYRFVAQEKEFARVFDAIGLSAKADFLFYRSRTANPEHSPNYDRTQGLLDAVVVQGQVNFEF